MFTLHSIEDNKANIKILVEILKKVNFPLLERIELNLDSFNELLGEYLMVFVSDDLFPKLRSIGLTNFTFTFNNKIDLIAFVHSFGFAGPFRGNRNIERINMEKEIEV